MSVIKIQSIHKHPVLLASHCQITYEIPALFHSECAVNSDTQDLCKQHSLIPTANYAALVVFKEHQRDLTDHDFQLFKISKTNSNSYFLGKLHIDRYIFMTHSKQDLNESYSSLAISQAIKLSSQQEIRARP